MVVNKTDYLTSIFIVGTILSTEKFSAIKEIISKTPALNKIPHLNSLKEDTITRERSCSTGFGHGIAVAHGKTQDVSSVNISLGISRKGIDYNSYDGEPVHLLFLMVNPPQSTISSAEYLNVLSSIVRVVKNKAFREKLLSCKNKRSVKTNLIEALLTA